MKKLILLFCLLTLTLPSFGWGRVGHATVAEVAERHLTKKARRYITGDLDGKSLASISSDADTYRSVWTLDLGFIPTNPDDARVKWLKKFDFSTPLNISPWSHSITVDESFRSYRTDNLAGAYINNDAYYVDSLATYMKKHHKSMSQEERYRTIALIVHFMGDMHCPMHIVYRPKNELKGHTNYIFRGKKTSMHKMWDKWVFAEYPKDFREMANNVDTASKKEIRLITSGSVYDWAGRAAEACWPLHCEFEKGTTIPDSYPADKRDILFKELRDGGYRLSAVLNWIFR